MTQRKMKQKRHGTGKQRRLRSGKMMDGYQQRNRKMGPLRKMESLRSKNRTGGRRSQTMQQKMWVTHNQCRLFQTEQI